MTDNRYAEVLRHASAALWEGLLATFPLLGTYVGDERHDHELPHLGEEGRSREDAVLGKAEAAAATLDPSALGDEDRLTYDLLTAIVTQGRARLATGYDRFEAAGHLDGPVSMLGSIASIQLTDTPERLDRYEARLRALPRYFEEAAGVVHEAVAAGVLAPRVVVERSIASLDRLLQLPLERSPAMARLSGDAARERLLPVVRDAVYPAHEGFRSVLRDIALPAAPERIGLGSLPGGDEMYASEIQVWTTLPLDPVEVHEQGRALLDQIQDERHRLAAALGYDGPQEAVAERVARGLGTLTSPGELLALVEDQVARSWEAAPAFFGRLPRANCAVRLVEEFRQADQPFAFYNPPTRDGSRPGMYYVNPFELQERAVHQVAGVTFHEANPGHHFQISLEQEVEGRSQLRRYGGWIVGSAFAEGWGLYAERLADEMGLYLDDWERLGMLENQGLRAARLVTDTGIHALGWTREAAIEVLGSAGQAPADAAIEIDRYICVPAQALCYMIGMIEIERAREKAIADGQSLRDFHDAMLANGSLPLPSFRRLFGID